MAERESTPNNGRSSGKTGFRSQVFHDTRFAEAPIAARIFWRLTSKGSAFPSHERSGSNAPVHENYTGSIPVGSTTI